LYIHETKKYLALQIKIFKGDGMGWNWGLGGVAKCMTRGMGGTWWRIWREDMAEKARHGATALAR